jgi:glycerol-3-phosphate acyltransferase PlsX
MITLAVDCMGGDHGPRVTLAACRQFLEPIPMPACCWWGSPEALAGLWCMSAPAWWPATEVVTMDDPVEVALRRKKDSSMRVAIQQVKDGVAHAAVSAGNTGALMAIARYCSRRWTASTARPLPTQLPNAKGGSTTVLDLGANVDCTGVTCCSLP